ncbi:hypothetical protein KKB55_03220, partial [Myxococcota bacterium]|nr:hypothetical protein [Myxococcota bacterium]
QAAALPVALGDDPRALLRAYEQLAAVLAEGAPRTVAVQPLIEATRRARAAHEAATRRLIEAQRRYAEHEERARRLEEEAQREEASARLARQAAEDQQRQHAQLRARLAEIPATIKAPIYKTLSYPITHWRVSCEAIIEEASGARFIGRAEAEDSSHAGYPFAGLEADPFELTDAPQQAKAEADSRAKAGAWLAGRLEAERAQVLAEVKALPPARALDALLGLALNDPHWAAANEALAAHLQAHHQLTLAPLLALLPAPAQAPSAP